MEANALLGHRPNGDGVQIHSAGPLYPAVVYAIEFYPNGYDAGAVQASESSTLFHAVLVYGFEWGVFRTHADAEMAARLIMECKRLKDEGHTAHAFTVALDLGKFLNRRRAARHGLVPFGWEAPEAFEIDEAPAATLADQRDMGEAIERQTVPTQIREKYGAGPGTDAWLRSWGFDPQIF